MKNINAIIRGLAQNRGVTRRELLKMVGALGFVTLPWLNMRISSATHSNDLELDQSNEHLKNSDWMAEARIGGLSISGIKVDSVQLAYDLNQLIKQGVTVVEADSRLSDYLSDVNFKIEVQRIKDTTEIIHQHGLKVVWYIPSLEVITPNGLSRKDSFARTHPDWLQLSFDGETRGVFYGSEVYWVEENDESAWLCPNTPYRDWFKDHLRQLAETGVDGLWLDVPIFDQIVVKWGCACSYCQAKFTHQTGMGFPQRFDLSDKAFWRFVRWRHETITEFLEDCRKTIQSVNPNIAAIAEIVALDHMGATQHGSEGSSLRNLQVVWEVDAISETTAMAEASYDDWMILHNIYKYCRGATKDRPSWVFCYGYNEDDGQLVLASAVAAQNNPYELRAPKMTTTVGMEFRQDMFNWISQHSGQIFLSQSIAPVAVIYSERNRDFLDALHTGGIFLSSAPPARNRKWLGRKSESPVNMEYMGDYRGQALLLFQNQIPTDIYPISRVDKETLGNYSVLMIPYMATLSLAEKEMLLEAVLNGTYLIVTGPEPGLWDDGGARRGESLWADINPYMDEFKSSIKYGKGKVYFWKDLVGQKYLKSHADDLANSMLSWLKECSVEAWTTKKLPVVVQPYILEHQIIIHVLNYSWIGGLSSKPNRLGLELSVPWGQDKEVVRVTQSEPGWPIHRSIAFIEQSGRIVIPLEIGINALIVIDFEKINSQFI